MPFPSDLGRSEFPLDINNNGWICYVLDWGISMNSVTTCKYGTIMWRHIMPHEHQIIRPVSL